MVQDGSIEKEDKLLKENLDALSQKAKVYLFFHLHLLFYLFLMS